MIRPVKSAPAMDWGHFCPEKAVFHDHLFVVDELRTPFWKTRNSFGIAIREIYRFDYRCRWRFAIHRQQIGGHDIWSKVMTIFEGFTFDRSNHVVGGWNIFFHTLGTSGHLFHDF